MSKFNPANVPAWVSGGSTNDGSSRKYLRAVKFLQDKNKELVAQAKDPVEITEETVKDLYIQYNGLLLDTESEPEEANEPAPKARTRKA